MDLNGQQPAAGTCIVLIKAVRILIGVKSLSVGKYCQRCSVERTADRQQIVERTALLSNVRAAAGRSVIGLVHVDGPRQPNVLIHGLVDVTDSLIDLAVADNTGSVIHAALGSSTVRRTGVVIRGIYCAAGGILDRDLVVLDLVRFIDYCRNNSGSEERNERFRGQSGLVMRVRSDQSVARARIIAERDRLAGGADTMCRSIAFDRPCAGLQSKRSNFNPCVRTELRPDVDGVVIGIRDRFSLKALRIAVKVSIQYSIAEHYFFKAILAGCQIISILFTQRFDLDLVVR